MTSYPDQWSTVDGKLVIETITPELRWTPGWSEPDGDRIIYHPRVLQQKWSIQYALSVEYEWRDVPTHNEN